MKTLTNQLKALSDENRLKILSSLKCDEVCACEILDTFDITQPTMSHHMKVLTDSGLVHARKDGKWVHYTVDKPAAKALIDALSKILNI